MTMRWRLRMGVVYALLASLAGCAATPSKIATTAPQALAAPAAHHATIVSVRPVMLTTPQINNSMLSAIGSPAAASDVQSFLHSQQMEFIVLEDGASQPVSVVQSNAAQWRAGERVLLTRDGRTRLARD